jgi:hypothetical protein
MALSPGRFVIAAFSGVSRSRSKQNHGVRGADGFGAAAIPHCQIGNAAHDRFEWVSKPGGDAL